MRHEREKGRENERGSVTLWVLYWALTILFLSGFAIDLWRGVAVRRSLVEQAEAAAAAGANGLDVELFRDTGQVALDPARAEALALDNLAAQGENDLITGSSVSVDSAANKITVELSSSVDFTLIKVFLPDERPLDLGVEASASPREVSP